MEKRERLYTVGGNVNWCSHCFPGGSVGKGSTWSAGDTGDVGSIPGSGTYPEERNGNLLHYSSLENLMDRGTWSATIHRVTHDLSN